MKYILLNFTERPMQEPMRYRLDTETDAYLVAAPAWGRGRFDEPETLTKQPDGTLVNRHGTGFVRIKPDRRKKPYTVRYDGQDGSVVRKFATLVEVQEYVRARWEGADYIDGPCAWHNDYGQFTAIGFRLADLGERGKPGTDAYWTWEWHDILGTLPTPPAASQAQEQAPVKLTCYRTDCCCDRDHPNGQGVVPTMAEIRAKLSGLGLTVSTETFWRYEPIESRRALLRAADLWDGNTYAALRWEELPAHIRGHLINANVDRQEVDTCEQVTEAPRQFRTPDGYTFYLLPSGAVADRLDIEEADMAFETLAELLEQHPGTQEVTK